MLALLIVFMSACGGGGSSSGGGGNANTETRGVFVGQFRITIESGSMQVHDGGTMTLFVEDTRVTRDPGTDATSGSLDGDSFAIQNSASVFLNDSGVSCTGLVQQVGIVEPGEVNGNIFSANLFCNGTPFSISGTFRTKFTRSAL